VHPLNSYFNDLRCIHRDWLTHQHRDTLSSIVGHPTLTSYLAIADGEAVGRVKFEMMEVRLLALHKMTALTALTAHASALWTTPAKGRRMRSQAPISSWCQVNMFMPPGANIQRRGESLILTFAIEPHSIKVQTYVMHSCNLEINLVLSSGCSTYLRVLCV
jgi:hypothetical protein